MKEHECDYCGKEMKRSEMRFNNQLQAYVCTDCQEELKDQERESRKKWI
jgi:transposase-like protein